MVGDLLEVDSGGATRAAACGGGAEPDTRQAQRTLASLGLHWMSSTESVWDGFVLLLTIHVPAGG